MPPVPHPRSPRITVWGVSTVRIAALAAAGLLLLSGAVFGLSELLRAQRTERAFITQPVQRIVVEADAGDVAIVAGLTSDVMIRRRDTWIVQRPSVRETLHDGTLTIATGCGGLRAILRCRTDLAIDAPPEIDVDVRTHDGDVDLRGLSGRARVETDSGDIRTQRLAPVTLHADTDGGNMRLDLFGAPTRTDVASAAGNIRLVVPFGPYRVDAEARRGEVRVDGLIRDDLAPQAIRAVTKAGDVTVQAR